MWETLEEYQGLSDILHFCFHIFVCCMHLRCKIYKLISDLGLIGLFRLASMNFGILEFWFLCIYVLLCLISHGSMFLNLLVCIFSEKHNPLLHLHVILTFLFRVCSILMLTLYRHALAEIYEKESII